MSTILKALRRLEEDHPSGADGAPNANLPATDPRAADALRDRILAEEIAARAAEPDESPASSRSRSLALVGVAALAFVAGVGLYWLTSGGGETTSGSSDVLAQTTAIDRGATPAAPAAATADRDSAPRVAATTKRPVAPTNAPDSSPRPMPRVQPPPATATGPDPAEPDGVDLSAERAFASAQAARPTGDRGVSPTTAPSERVGLAGAADVGSAAGAQPPDGEAAAGEASAREAAAATLATRAPAATKASSTTKATPGTAKATPAETNATPGATKAAPEAEDDDIDSGTMAVAAVTPTAAASSARSSTRATTSPSRTSDPEPPSVSAAVERKPAAAPQVTKRVATVERETGSADSRATAPGQHRPGAGRAPRKSEAVASRTRIPDLSVLRTSWHPDTTRRSARIRLEATDQVLTLREGDAVGGLVIQEISPSAVLFQTGDIEIRRRVGQGASSD